MRDHPTGIEFGIIHYGSAILTHEIQSHIVILIAFQSRDISNPGDFCHIFGYGSGGNCIASYDKYIVRTGSAILISV